MIPKTTFVELLLSAYMYCLSLKSSIQEELLNHKSCLHIFNETYCWWLFSSKNLTLCRADQDIVQKMSSQWGIYLSLSQNIPSIFSTILFGIYSDKIGRKTFMLLPIIGNIISSISLALIAHFKNSSIYYLFLGSFIAGFFGGFYALLSSCFSTIADLTTQESRTKRVVFGESMINLGTLLGVLTGGVIVGKFGFVPAYCLVCGIYLLQIVYWLFLKETRPSRKKLSINDIIDVKGQLFGIFSAKRGGTFKICLAFALLAFFLDVFCLFGIPTAAYKYILREPFNFSPTMMGYFSATIYACSFSGMLFSDYIFVHLLKWKDPYLVILGGIGLAGCTLSLAFSVNRLGIFLSALAILLVGASTPAVRSIISKMFLASEQGKVFAFVAFLEAISNLISNVLVNYIYKKTVSLSPSIVFFVIAGVTGVLVFLTILLIIFRVEQNYQLLENEDEHSNPPDNSPPTESC